jgi:hypothetical protein
MNPNNQAAPAPNPMNDISPPATSKPELVDSIPVQQQANPITGSTKSIEGVRASSDKDLEKVLQDTSKEVTNPANKSAQFAPLPKEPSKDRRIAHFLPVVAAFLIAGILSAAAYYSFRQSNGNDSPTASSNSQNKVDSGVTADDLEDFYQSASTELNGLDEAQDFNLADLSDQTLGL